MYYQSCPLRCQGKPRYFKSSSFPTVRRQFWTLALSTVATSAPMERPGLAPFPSIDVGPASRTLGDNIRAFSEDLSPAEGKDGAPCALELRVRDEKTWL